MTWLGVDPCVVPIVMGTFPESGLTGSDRQGHARLNALCIAAGLCSVSDGSHPLNEIRASERWWVLWGMGEMASCSATDFKAKGQSELIAIQKI